MFRFCDWLKILSTTTNPEWHQDNWRPCFPRLESVKSFPAVFTGSRFSTAFKQFSCYWTLCQWQIFPRFTLFPRLYTIWLFPALGDRCVCVFLVPIGWPRILHLLWLVRTISLDYNKGRNTWNRNQTFVTDLLAVPGLVWRPWSTPSRTQQ